MSGYGQAVGDAMKGLLVLSAIISVAGVAFGYLAGRLVSRRQDNEQVQKTVALAAQNLDQNASAVAAQNLANNSPAVVSPIVTNNSSNLQAHAITAGCTILGGCAGIVGAVALLTKYVPRIKL